ncbi:MAG: hypothetical protein OEV79_10895 [candidate division WOR-3 bacterium]|nr:hypothetical protein [candidate division WOR-3 bacterium]
MRRMLIIVTLFSLLINCSYSLQKYRIYERGEIITLHESVGECIDVRERQEYDLFPLVSDFVEARFYDIPNSGCEIRLMTDMGDFRGEFRVTSRDPLTVDILSEYINTSKESAFSKKDFETKWRILDYDSVGLPITEIEVNRVRRKNFRYIFGGVGLVTGGFFGYFIIASTLGEDWVLSWPGALIGSVAGWITGWKTVGKDIDEKEAIKAIKRARQPVLVN